MTSGGGSESRAAFSALVVPVPAADWLVGERAPQWPDSWTGPLFGAHVTLLTPFTPVGELDEGVLAELEELFADVTPFGFRLTEVARFPSGFVYLCPDPAAPFRTLTHELERRFPEYPPYAGQFDEVVPHLTVPTLAGEGTDDVQRLLDAHGPIATYAREAQLVWVAGRAVEVVREFPFGTLAA